MTSVWITVCVSSPTHTSIGRSPSCVSVLPAPTMTWQCRGHSLEPRRPGARNTRWRSRGRAAITESQLAGAKANAEVLGTQLSVPPPHSNLSPQWAVEAAAAERAAAVGPLETEIGRLDGGTDRDAAGEVGAASGPCLLLCRELLTGSIGLV